MFVSRLFSFGSDSAALTFSGKKVPWVWMLHRIRKMLVHVDVIAWWDLSLHVRVVFFIYIWWLVARSRRTLSSLVWKVTITSRYVTIRARRRSSDRLCGIQTNLKEFKTVSKNPFPTASHHPHQPGSFIQALYVLRCFSALYRCNKARLFWLTVASVRPPDLSHEQDRTAGCFYIFCVRVEADTQIDSWLAVAWFPAGRCSCLMSWLVQSNWVSLLTTCSPLWPQFTIS